jgi:hypothetical protein
LGTGRRIVDKSWRFAAQAYFHHREIMVTLRKALQGIFTTVKEMI